MRLGLCQYAITRITSLAHYTARFNALIAEGAANADLLLLPEYACMELAAALTSEPSPAAELAAICAQTDYLLSLFQAAAIRHQIWLAPGTLPMKSPGGQIHNRAPLISPTGAIAFQDKHVMTRFESETWNVSPGAPPNIFQTQWGRIGIAICYDSEFPLLIRAQVEAGAWLILIPACTDTAHGFNRVSLSARARALENQCFTALAPTVGDASWLATLDSNRGRAAVYGPVDRGFPETGIMAEGPPNIASWLFTTLNPACLATVRHTGAVLNHRDWPEHPPAAPIATFQEPA